MPNGVEELQKYMAVSKYARWLKEAARREVWSETTGRYAGMLKQKYPERAAEIDRVCAGTERFEVMPSMRGLQFGGPPVFQHHARLYNCTGSYLDRLRFFSEAFYLLLAGSGVGFSVQERHLRHLPKFSKKRLAGVKLPKKTFKVPDTIEGWADCPSVMMSAYHEEPVRGFEEYHDCEPAFDYTGVRDAGAELSFGIGRAPGPMPLRNANERVRRLLNKATESGLAKMDSLTGYDVGMHYADAVVSGGVRRSATIVVFDLWDQAMLMAKTGNWRAKHPHRGRSNNSAMLVRGQVTFEQFMALFAATKEFGEPGFYWCDDADGLPNPCVEIGFWPRLRVEGTAPSTVELLKTYQGPVERCGTANNTLLLSGWQMCNLTTINGKTLAGSNHEKAADFHRRCRDASLLGTWQAGFTDFPYLGKVSEEIVRREALLGVSISGIMHHPEVLLDPAVLREGAKRVLETNETEAARIGIDPCARATCEKPDGNSASALGSFSGAHAGKFRKGFRIAQANTMEAPYQHFKSVNPQACEPSVWSANKTDDVVRFCLEYEGLMEEDMTAVGFLDHIKTVYENWVVPGKVVSRCTQPWLSHNVSNTVRVRPEEWDGVARHIYAHRDVYSGNSFISATGDRDYPQAPFTSVYDPDEQERMYGAAAAGDDAGLLLLNVSAAGFRDVWDAADLALGMWHERTATAEQVSWVAELDRFAGTHFGNDRKRATYCLKDKHNWALYVRLKGSYVAVDYSLMREETNGVKLQQEAACAGGGC